MEIHSTYLQRLTDLEPDEVSSGRYIEVTEKYEPVLKDVDRIKRAMDDSFEKGGGSGVSLERERVHQIALGKMYPWLGWHALDVEAAFRVKVPQEPTL